MNKICAIIPLYNFAKNELVEVVHKKALEDKEKEVDYYTIRASLTDADEWTIKTDSVLWQKEALINFAIERLKNDYEFIAWIDSGIGLDKWHDKVMEKFDKGADILQLFHRGVWLNADGSEEKKTWGQIFAKKMFITRNASLKQPKFSAGGAWICRSSVFNKIKLYDRCIVGGGDTVNLNGLCHMLTPDALINKKMTNNEKRLIKNWKTKAENLNLEADFIYGCYRHYFHGGNKGRKHHLRYNILTKNFYNPMSMVQKKEILEWTKEATPRLRTEVQNFILGRN